MINQQLDIEYNTSSGINEEQLEPEVIFVAVSE